MTRKEFIYQFIIHNAWDNEEWNEEKKTMVCNTSALIEKAAELWELIQEWTSKHP